MEAVKPGLFTFDKILLNAKLVLGRFAVDRVQILFKGSKVGF